MARASGVATYYASALPWALDDDGQPIEGTPLPGLVQVTRPHHPLPADETHAEPRHVFEVEPGRTPPGSPATVTVLGGWTVEALATLHPDSAPYCLDAEWEEDDGEGGTTIRRGRIVEVPEGVTPVRTNLPSHQWAGDGP